MSLKYLQLLFFLGVLVVLITPSLAKSQHPPGTGRKLPAVVEKPQSMNWPIPAPEKPLPTEHKPSPGYKLPIVEKPSPEHKPPHLPPIIVRPPPLHKPPPPYGHYPGHPPAENTGN